MSLFAVGDNLELLSDDSLANADDDDDLGLWVAVKPGGRFWQLLVIVCSAVSKDENSVGNIWTIADGLEECVVNGEIKSFGGFGSFSFIWNVGNGFEKVGLGVVVVRLDSEDRVFVEGDYSNSSFVFANREIFDESDDVFTDVLKIYLISCFGNVENDVR